MVGTNLNISLMQAWYKHSYYKKNLVSIKIIRNIHFRHINVVLIYFV